MALIGALTEKDGASTGTIRTQFIDVKAQHGSNKENGRSKDPDICVHAGSAKTGAASCKGLEDGEISYLDINLDNPRFAKPSCVALFENEKEDNGKLDWNCLK
jgi:uncharacterized protein (DUF736 family)